MERIDFIKEAIFLSGMSSEDVIRELAQDVSKEFLQNLAESHQNENPMELLTTETREVEVGMFYYNKDKTFSKELIKGKHPSGVVCYVDKTGHHGLVLALREKRLPWSSEKLWIDNMPEGFSGKENTSLIIKASQTQRKKAEAAEYCANYAYDGIKAGEAFLPSKEEQDKTKNNFELIKFSLHKIKAKKIKEEYYWSSSEYSRYFTWSLFFYNNRMYVNLKRTTQYVRPMMSF